MERVAELEAANAALEEQLRDARFESNRLYDVIDAGALVDEAAAAFEKGRGKGGKSQGLGCGKGSSSSDGKGQGKNKFQEEDRLSRSDSKDGADGADDKKKPRLTEAAENPGEGVGAGDGVVVGEVAAAGEDADREQEHVRAGVAAVES